MTLLELLREHLKEWPEDVRAISQDSDGRMNENLHRHPMPWGEPQTNVHGVFVWTAGEWRYMDNPGALDDCWTLPVADDASTAIVTREMWESAP